MTPPRRSGSSSSGSRARTPHPSEQAPRGYHQPSKVVARAGGTTVLTPAAEIYAALERGVIDAAEWNGPHDDMKMGLHRTARYDYYPGWHEPGTTNGFGFNKTAYDALPVDLRRTLDHAAAVVQVYGGTDFHVKNAIALERLRTEFKGQVEILPLPTSVLRDLKKLATEVVREESEKSPMANQPILTGFQSPAWAKVRFAAPPPRTRSPEPWPR